MFFVLFLFLRSDPMDFYYVTRQKSRTRVCFYDITNIIYHTERFTIVVQLRNYSRCNNIKHIYFR